MGRWHVAAAARPAAVLCVHARGEPAYEPDRLAELLSSRCPDRDLALRSRADLRLDGASALRGGRPGDADGRAKSVCAGAGRCAASAARHDLTVRPVLAAGIV